MHQASEESQSEIENQPRMIHRAQSEQEIIKSLSLNTLFRHLESTLKGLGILSHFIDGQTEATVMLPFVVAVQLNRSWGDVLHSQVLL